MIPLGIYIHIPWCIRKCPYCDFNSHSGDTSEDQYFDALCLEWEERSKLVQGRSISSIYIGGGTPNIFSPDFYARLLPILAQKAQFASDCEITIEANPGQGRHQDFEGYWQAGCNRVSIGVQSFNHNMLKVLGRDYTPDELHTTLSKAHSSPFSNINHDIIFSLPHQDMEMMQQDLQASIAWSPTHISHYELTIEPNTAFYRKPPHGLPEGDIKADMYQHSGKILQNANYEHYEVSAYAKPSHNCKHNLNYWLFGDYIGLGAGAHAKITCSDTAALYRYTNKKQPGSYMLEPITQLQLQHTEDLVLQYCLNTFRLVDGFHIADAEQRLGKAFGNFLTKIQPLIDSQFLERDNHKLKLSAKGFLHQNSLLAEML